MKSTKNSQNILKLRVGFLLLLFTFTPLYSVLSDSDITWTEDQPAGDADGTWRAIASDSTGTNLIAGFNGGRLYTSANGGTTWIERQPAGDADADWNVAASDADGSNLIVGISPGRLFVSSDSGATWTESQPAGDVKRNWQSVASDADGSKLIAVIYSSSNGSIYTSSDGGVTWIKRTPTGTDDKEDWSASASDADGSNLIVSSLTSTDGRIYSSSDYGATWSERQPAGASTYEWNAVASDATGEHLLSAVEFGRLYSSSDYGATWSERQPAGANNRGWVALVSDSDGTNFMAGEEETLDAGEGRLYTGILGPGKIILSDAYLTLIKTVENKEIGTKIISDFALFIDDTPVTNGTKNTLSAGSKVASESSFSDYTASVWGGDCDDEGIVVLEPGDDKTCTITNTYSGPVTATLIIKKVLINDSGATMAISSFSFSVNKGEVQSFEADGQNDLSVPAGTYTVTETTVSDYTTTYDGCSDILLAVGETAICTITNDDNGVAVSPTPTPQTSNGGGGSGGNGPISNTFGVSAPAVLSAFVTIGSDGIVTNSLAPALVNTEGRVLGTNISLTNDSLSCPERFSEFVIPNQKNSPDIIKKLQEFLNEYQSVNLTINGLLNQSTLRAIRQFQLTNKDEVLKPWGLSEATGNFYLTTRRKANIEYCRLHGSVKEFPMPKLIPYKKGLLNF